MASQSDVLAEAGQLLGSPPGAGQQNQFSLANQAAANAAMTAANQVRTPFAVTGNTAMQIQGAPSSNQLAGQIATGLGGLSRNQRRFQNTTLNV